MLVELEQATVHHSLPVHAEVVDNDPKTLLTVFQLLQAGGSSAQNAATALHAFD
jgi:hypothetical protein